MIITIHQPEHLPWLGFFNKMAKADVYVILDNVPFRKNYVQNRNRILGTNGVSWLGVPVHISGHTNSAIRDIKIVPDSKTKWKAKYLRTIEQSYRKHPHYESIYPIVESIIAKSADKIADVNIEIFREFANAMNITPEFVYASDLSAEGKKSGLILGICKDLNADTYIAGPSGRDYLNINDFTNNAIKVVFNDYIHPVYPQKRSVGFIPMLSILDLLMNCGFDHSVEILMSGNESFSEK